MVYSERSTGKIIFGLIILVGLAFLVYLFFGSRLGGIFGGESLRSQILGSRAGDLVLDMPLDTDSTTTLLQPDNSGNGHDGTVSGGAIYHDVTSGNCMIGGCMSFVSGTQFGQFIEVADSVGLDIVDQLTISAWVKPAEVIGIHYTVLSKGTASPPFTDHGYSLEINDSKAQFVIGDQILTSSTNIPVGQFTNLTAIYDGLNMKIYINGELDATFAATSAIPANNDPLSIGATPGGGAQYTGFIDDVQVYSSAFTTEEVSTLYFQNTVLGIIESLRNSPNNADVVERHNTAKQLLEILARQL